MGMIERKKAILLNEPHLVTVQSGNTQDSTQIASFKTDMAIPMKSLRVDFSPIQAGSGDPSPSNVRAINGRTGLTVKRAGVNLLECDTFANGNQKGITYNSTRNSDNQIESITMKGTGTESNAFRNLNYTANMFKLLDGRLAFNAYSSQANIQPVSNVMIYAEDGTYMGNHATAGWYVYNIDHTIHTPSWTRIQAFPYNATNIEYDTTVYPMMCLAQDQGCDFEPYKGTDISVSWQSEARTLYGGYVDLISGELIADKKLIHLDSNHGWTFNANYVSYANRAYSNHTVTDAYAPLATNIILSDKFICELSAGPHPYRACINSNRRFILGVPTTIDNLESFTEWLDNMGGIDVVYSINPIHYTLTPQQIKTFIGRNNIWSDAGNVEVKYWTH